MALACVAVKVIVSVFVPMAMLSVDSNSYWYETPGVRVILVVVKASLRVQKELDD